MVVDDHWLVRDGLRRAISGTEDLEVIGEAASVSDFFTWSLGARSGNQIPDVILLDLCLSEGSSLGRIRQIKETIEGVKVLALSMLDEDPFAIRAIEDGADGYISKSSNPQELFDAIRIVASGQRYISSSVADLLARSLLRENTLSPREAEIARHYARGLKCIEIAQMVSISPKTVSTHKRNAMRKVGARNNAELIRWALENSFT